EKALPLPAAAPDAEVVAPDLAAGRRDRLVDEVRPDRVAEDLRQSEPDVETRGPSFPHGPVLRRAIEDGIAVLDPLPGVPRSRHDGRRDDDEHERTPGTGNRDGDHDGGEGPERE